MNIGELNYGDPLRLIEVSNHVNYRDQFMNLFEVEHKRIYMKLYTDGEIYKESEETSERIDKYYIKDQKYDYVIDTLKSKDIYLRKHSFVIVLLIAKEFQKEGKYGGYYDVVKDVNVYLDNVNNKASLKNAKKALRKINYKNRPAIIQNIIADKNIEFEKQNNENIYKLKKVSK